MSIPIILLTGYLGAGKTTVLNRLLAAPWVRDCAPALIINEFGKLGVDGKLVAEPWRKVEINQGSLFCTCTRAQFVQAMSDLAASTARPGLVLIESTGIAETRGIEGSLAIPALTAAFHLRANVCVVDAENFVKVAAFLSVAVQQVRWADGVLITKCDRVPESEAARLQEVLHDLNPMATARVTPYGEGAAEFVRGLTHHERAAGEPADRPPADIVAVSVEHDAEVDRSQFLDAIAALGPRLLRLKGNVNFAGQGHRFVEVVYDRLTEGEAKPGFARRTAFTAIGWRVPPEELRARLDCRPCGNAPRS